MPANVKHIAEKMGAVVVGEVSDTGGGAFGAARLAKAVARLKARLQPSSGKRPGRPTAAAWVHKPKVPMSDRTKQKLMKLARSASSPDRRISYMQLAAQLLEEALKDQAVR